MQLCDINPFMRYADLQPSVLAGIPFCRAYDYRIFYIVEGEAKFHYMNRVIAIEKGDLIYFRPGVPYYFQGKVKVIVLNFDMTRAQSHKKTPKNPLETVSSFDSKMIFENDPPPELEELIVLKDAFDMEGKLRRCVGHYCLPSVLSDAASSALIKEILCYMVESVSKESGENPEVVKKVLLYIQQNYEKEISNASIAAQFGYHEFYMNRIFKKSTGMTLHKAILRERIRVACSLLQSTDLSVQRISSEVGFSDRSQFCTAFKKHTSYTPTDYRKKKVGAT